MSTKKLRVWWIPQVPMQSFHVPVKTLEEAHLILETLSYYDQFQFENNIKPDYSNTGGLQEFDEDEQEWLDWMDDKTGMDFYEYRAENFEPYKMSDFVGETTT